jgi:hypothetical protein
VRICFVRRLHRSIITCRSYEASGFFPRQS